MSANFSNGSSAQQNATCGLNLEEPSPVRISKMFVLSTIFLLSLIGNTLITIVVYKRKNLRKTVNYFIVNMAFSDIIFPLIAIPVRLAGIATSSWKWYISGIVGFVFCKILLFLQNVSLTVSVQSLVWIAVDRFVAVVFPMKIHLISTRFRVFAIISTWIVALMINLTDLYTAVLVDFNGVITCQFNIASLLYINFVYVRVSLIWIAPLIFMTILYCAIGATLQRQDQALRQGTVHRNDQRKRNVIRMSLCIMVAFYLLALIPIISAIIFVSHKWKTLMSHSTFCLFYNTISFIGFLLMYLSSTINPVICFIFVESYRHGLRELFSPCKRLRKRNMETGRQEAISLQRIRVYTE